jgi:hypothetical protein
MPDGRQVQSSLSHFPSSIPCLTAGRFPLIKKRQIIYCSSKNVLYHQPEFLTVLFWVV